MKEPQEPSQTQQMKNEAITTLERRALLLADNAMWRNKLLEIKLERAHHQYTLRDYANF